MRVIPELNMVVVADNDRASFVAARNAEKAAASEKAEQLSSLLGLDAECCKIESSRLERKIVEERQVKYSKGNPEGQQVREFVGKVLAIQRTRRGQPYRNSTTDEINAVLDAGNYATR